MTVNLATRKKKNHQNRSRLHVIRMQINGRIIFKNKIHQIKNGIIFFFFCREKFSLCIKVTGQRTARKTTRVPNDYNHYRQNSRRTASVGRDKSDTHRVHFFTVSFLRFYSRRLRRSSIELPSGRDVSHIGARIAYDKQKETLVIMRFECFFSSETGFRSLVLGPRPADYGHSVGYQSLPR